MKRIEPPWFGLTTATGILLCLVPSLSPACTQLPVAAESDSISSPPAVAPLKSPECGDDLQILFIWGVGGRNRMDTTAGTLAKDLVSDPPVTVPFELSREQLERVSACADSMGFWRLPQHIAPPGTLGHASVVTPCDEFVLRLADGDRERTVRWDNCHDRPRAERDRIEPLEELLMGIVAASDTYRRLPEARGSYF